MKRQNTYPFYVNPGRKECGYNGTVSSYAEAVQYSEINNTKPRLLDEVRNALSIRHYSLKTEKSYVRWIKDYIYFHNKKHPADMGEQEINKYITHLAVNKKVSSSTQNHALCAIVFLYKNVLRKDINDLGPLVWAKKTKKIPVVFSKDEVQAILEKMNGTYRLMAMLLYGSGLRLTECLHLRVKDIDFDYNQITVRDAKGNKDRTVPLPQIIKEDLGKQIENVRKIHIKNLEKEFGSVEMSSTLSKKYRKAEYPFGW